jgi:mannose-6-phosphate isomerase
MNSSDRDRADLTPMTASQPIHRPWGRFTVLGESQAYKVKSIEVMPRQRLSYQKHRFRSEHWFIVAGSATVTIDGAEHHIGAGDAIDIPRGSAHRIANADDTMLTFVEVQTGEAFDETDIIRIEDDYDRA